MKFTNLTSRVVVLPVNDIDTDQIIPAQFLKVTDKAGLGDNLFFHWRKDPDFVLNQPASAGCQVLVAGDNFGCGSSREHAPWALCDFGFRAVISTSFADIFRGNALKNNLLPVVVDKTAHAELLAGGEVAIDLTSQTLTLPSGRTVEFPIDAFSKRCLLEGIDQLGYLLSKSDAISAYESQSLAPSQSLPPSQSQSLPPGGG